MLEQPYTKRGNFNSFKEFGELSPTSTSNLILLGAASKKL